MKTSGIILELNNKRAIVMTNDAGFKAIQSKPGMFIGQQVDIGKSPVKMPILTGIRYSYSLGFALSVVFLFILVSLVIFSSQNKVYAYMSVDINPSIELAINRDMRIITIKGLNQDGKVLLRGIHFKNMPVEKALMTLIRIAKQNQFFHNDGHYVLIAAAIKPESLNKPFLLDQSIEKVRENLKEQDIHLHFIRTTLTQRKAALQENLSLGRYLLSHKAIQHGQLLNPGQAKTEPISALMKKAALIREPNVKMDHSHYTTAAPKINNKAAVRRERRNDAINFRSKTDGIQNDSVSQKKNPSGNPEKKPEKDNIKKTANLKGTDAKEDLDSREKDSIGQDHKNEETSPEVDDGDTKIKDNPGNSEHSNSQNSDDNSSSSSHSNSHSSHSNSGSHNNSSSNSNGSSSGSHGNSSKE
jgi:hypothetical protein